MAEREQRAKRGLFRRNEEPVGDSTADAAVTATRRGRRSTGDMFANRQAGFDDPWSSDAWAEDWNDEWNDPGRRASVRPAAAPRSADVDAWLASDETEFADVTADMARKWAPNSNEVTRQGATWDEPEEAYEERASDAQNATFGEQVHEQFGGQFGGPDREQEDHPDHDRVVPSFGNSNDAIEVTDEFTLEVYERFSTADHFDDAPVAQEAPAQETRRGFLLRRRNRTNDDDSSQRNVSDESAFGSVENAPMVEAHDQIDSDTNDWSNAPQVTTRSAPVTEEAFVNELNDNTPNQGSTWDTESASNTQPTQHPVQEHVSYANIASEPREASATSNNSTNTSTSSPNDSVADDGWDDDWTDSWDEPMQTRESMGSTAASVTLDSSDWDDLDDLDVSIDRDLADEFNEDVPAYVRRAEPQAPEVIRTPRIPAATAATPGRTAADDDLWDDADDSNALAAARLDEALDDTDQIETRGTDTRNAGPFDAIRTEGDTADLDNSTDTVVDLPTQWPTDNNAHDVDEYDDRSFNGDSYDDFDRESDHAIAASVQTDGAPGVSYAKAEASLQTTMERGGHDLSGSETLAKTLLFAGIGVGAIGAIRVVLAVLASRSFTASGIGRFASAANILGSSQGVLLMVGAALAVLGRFLAPRSNGRLRSLVGGASGVVLGGAAATFILGVAALFDAYGANRATNLTRLRSLAEFAALGGVSLLAFMVAWRSSADNAS